MCPVKDCQRVRSTRKIDRIALGSKVKVDKQDELNITFYEPEFAYDGNLTAMVASDHFNLTLQHLVYNKLVVATTSSTTQVAPTPKPPRTSAITFRPPIRLPVIPHHHHGPRWGPYFEDGDKEENVTARVGTTVRLDCKIGMLQDKMVSLLLPPHHAKLRTVRDLD
ncbi:hypothetical protein RUM44_011436 [Polyplax serrata]|uniref:Uncharacterized protein n=1 Tax=Polyplax serrata TaxID=468196 RepID=A0ABR1AQ21_POLSC